MKQFNCSILMIATIVLFSACHGTPEHMLFKDDPIIDVFNIKPENGKAALVVARTFSQNVLLYGSLALNFDNYVDKKMIGTSNSKSYFVKTDIAPGMHYVIAKGPENVEPVKLNFEPQKIYYIMEFARPGKWRPRVSALLVKPDELRTSLDSDCRLMVYDTKNPGNDLSDKDYEDAVRDYEREVKEGVHKEHAEYRGVPAK